MDFKAYFDVNIESTKRITVTISSLIENAITNRNMNIDLSYFLLKINGTTAWSF